MNTKVILITGGANGIGLAIANVLSAGGHSVIAIDNDKKAINEAKAQLKIPLQFLFADVTNEKEIKKEINKIAQTYGKIDVLINNAGISERQPFLGTTTHSWNRTLEINLTGLFVMAREVARHMVERNIRGEIINIASVSGMVGMPQYSSYNASKSGVIELTKTMAVELAPFIRTNAICPGYILTPMQLREYTPEQLEACASKIPSKRLGKPEEVSELVSFLVSGKAEFFNGSIIVMDGGETAGGLAS